MTTILVATFVVANVPGGCFAIQALGRGLRWSEAGLGSWDGQWIKCSSLIGCHMSHTLRPDEDRSRGRGQRPGRLESR